MIHFLFMLLGLCFGSFVNVCFSRKDWHKGRSRCDSCGYQLKWYDNIPIVSFLLLGGRCRKCKEKISLEHIVSEIFMGVAFLCGSLTFSKLGMWYGMTYFITLIIFAVAAIEDYKEQMVYSWILNLGIITTTIIVCIAHFFDGDYRSMRISIGIVIILKLLSFILSKIFKDKVGEGDFDIIIMMVALMGFYGAIFSTTVACVIGCIWCIPSILIKKKRKEDPIPLIPYLFIGTICYLLI